MAVPELLHWLPGIVQAQQLVLISLGLVWQALWGRRTGGGQGTQTNLLQAVTMSWNSLSHGI